MELDLIDLLLNSDFKSLDFNCEIVSLSLNLMVDFLFFNNTFLKLGNEGTIMLHCGLVFFKLKIFCVNLYVHGLNFLVSFVNCELSVFELLFPFLVIFSMLLYLFVKLIFGLIEKYFSLFELIL